MLQSVLLLASTVLSLKVVPHPQGLYGVSLTDLELIDPARKDLCSGAAQRRIPVSFFTPAGPVSQCVPKQQLYMPGPTARYWEQFFGSTYGLPLNNTFSQVALSLCEPASIGVQYPIIFFSPGQSFSRQFNNVLASKIAAYGFMVVTIDVPGQAGLTTYQDGSVQVGENLTTVAQLVAGLDTRLEDIYFVRKSLSANSSALGRPSCGYGSDSVAIFGHSFGGTTALSATLQDRHFLGGANLDGDYDVAPLNLTTTKPFLLLGGDDPLHPHNDITYPNWGSIWVNLLGPKWELRLTNSTHATFTDIPLVGEMFGIYDIPGTQGLLGRIRPMLALDVQARVLSSFAEFLFGRAGVSNVLDIVEGSSEVEVVKAANLEG